MRTNEGQQQEISVLHTHHNNSEYHAQDHGSITVSITTMIVVPAFSNQHHAVVEHSADQQLVIIELYDNQKLTLVCDSWLVLDDVDRSIEPANLLQSSCIEA